MALKQHFTRAARCIKKLFSAEPPAHQWDAEDDRHYERFERYAAAVKNDYPHLNYYQYLELEERSRRLNSLNRKPLPDPKNFR
jgi:hypothetical protein